MRIKSSRALRKMSLKNCHLCFTPLSLRTIFQRVSIMLNNWNFTLLKFRVLTLLFTWSIFLKIMNFLGTWSLQCRAPPIWACPISSSVLMSKKSINASLLTTLSCGLINNIWCIQRVFWPAYSLLSCFPGDASVTEVPQQGQSLQLWWMLLVVKVRTLHQQALLYQAVYSKHQPQGFLCWLET